MRLRKVKEEDSKQRKSNVRSYRILVGVSEREKFELGPGEWVASAALNGGRVDVVILRDYDA